MNVPAVDAIGKLGGMLISATGRGAQIAKYRRTSAAIHRLITLSAQITMLTETQQATFVPAMRDYANDPSPKHWEKIRAGIDHTVGLCQVLLEQIKASSDDIATKEFFADLIRLVLERDRTIVRLRDGPAPTTPEAVQIFRQHIDKYCALLDQLRTTNKALNSYIESIEVKNTFPTN